MRNSLDQCFYMLRQQYFWNYSHFPGFNSNDRIVTSTFSTKQSLCWIMEFGTKGENLLGDSPSIKFRKKTKVVDRVVCISPLSYFNVVLFYFIRLQGKFPSTYLNNLNLNLFYIFNLSFLRIHENQILTESRQQSLDCIRFLVLQKRKLRFVNNYVFNMKY